MPHDRSSQTGNTAPARSRDPLLDEAAALLLRQKAMPGDQALAKEVAVWRNQGARHDLAWKAAEKIWSLTGDLGSAHAVFAPKPAPRRARRWPSRRARRQGIIAAATAACLAIVAAPAIHLRMQADYRTGTGENRTVTLADGSKVQLDTGTAIAIDDGADTRGIKLLAGRAWFEVAHDRTRPFHVTADAVTVTVTGTQFDVGMTDKSIDVALAEGSVRAGYPAGDAQAENAMHPGDHLRFDRQTRRISSGTMPVGAIASWRQGQLLIEGATVDDIVDQIRPYYPGIIVVTDSGLGGRHVTGAFDVRDPVAALRTIVEPHAGRVRRVSPWLIFVSAS